MKKNRLNIPMTIDWNYKHNRKYFLTRTIIDRNYTTMAEVGVRDGRTTFYLLDHIPHLQIYAIDNNISLFYNNDIAKKYGDRLIAIEGDSSTVSNLIPLVDLVFIDADHSYKGVKKDILAYRNKVKENGMFAGHDIDYPGVNKAVNELVVNYDVGPNNVWFT